MNLKPEEKTEIQLYLWFKKYGCEVYLNRISKNIVEAIGNYPVFKTKLSQKKPDMIVRTRNFPQYLAIEIKNTEHSINIRQASKIIDYYDNYTKNKIQYYIYDKQIEISQFLIATTNSRYGHLFDKEFNEILDNRKSDNDGKRIAVKYGLIPNYEYRRTHEFIRDLWQNWKRQGKDTRAGIGLVLSSSLDNIENINEEQEGIPAYMSQRHNGYRWCQCWFRI